MTQYHPAPHPLNESAAAHNVARLIELLALVTHAAGRDPQQRIDTSALDEASRISAAYEAALPIVQRRFDALVAETAAWAAYGAEALLAAHDARPCVAAARLADALGRALGELRTLLAIGG